MIPIDENLVIREQRLRRWAKRLGYQVKKSKVRNPQLNGQGGYMIIHAATSIYGWCRKFDLTLDGVEGCLAAWEKLIQGKKPGES